MSVVTFVTLVMFVTVCYAMLRFVTKLNKAKILGFVSPLIPPFNKELFIYMGSRFQTDLIKKGGLN